MITKAVSIDPQLNISELCAVAKTPRSAFYYWKKHLNDRAIKDQDSLAMVRAIYEKSYAKAGVRTTVMEIERHFKVKLNPKKVARIKREYGITTKIRRKRKFNGFAFKNTEHSVKKNILNRKFNPKKANRVFSTDITEMRLANSQKIYLSAVKDLCTKEIVAYSTATRPGISLSLDVAKESLKNLPKESRKKLIFHSDQGIHYTNYAYRKILKDFKVKQSMSRRGNCLDNSPIESFFGHLKDELDLSTCFDYISAKKKIESYMFYYNNERPQWTLKSKTPAEYRGLVEGCPFI